MRRLTTYCMILGLAVGISCQTGELNDEGGTESETGDEDPTGDGDGAPGDGDGAPGDGDGTPGDGDGTPGDGDGAPGDGDGDPGDGDGNPGHGDGDVAEHVTIYEIQTGEAPWGWVSVVDVWVTGKREDGLWIQELDGGPYSGIWVYLGENSPRLGILEVGDLVDVVGVSGVFNEVTEINALNGDVVKVGSLGAPLPPDLITLSLVDDTWESVYVRVQGSLEVIALADGGEFIVDDGTAEGYVDDYVFNVPNAPEFLDFAVGATFTAIQGPLNYSMSTYKIIPRAAEDLEGYQSP